ncbi:polysaccharide deacetylase family protein [Stieleria mannarensis]|uniref:polysaccharide deacetylase family protein n=1 Tax=Stieleria mannarensis TaxID=2755585 RepID=UPI0016042B4A|nr:polysaccharide deacetylase family protein [Rhodopirellula sp. JC639]
MQTKFETAPPVNPSNDFVQPGVYLTFDVECSMGGAWADPNLKPVPPSRAIWGEYGDQKLGIPLIVKILEDHGLAATFFVDAFTEDQGFEGLTEPVCTYLLDHGQDVQLHVHPNKKHYAMKMRGEEHPFEDNIGALAPDAQLVLLQEGADRLQRWTGQSPAAFRAGNGGASEETLVQLEKVGIHVDSSYTFSGSACLFDQSEAYNGSKFYGNVLELGLSGFLQPNLPPLLPQKALDPVGISFAECRDTIQSVCDAGADAVLILHSFSLFKWKNVQYDGGRLNRIVTSRFRRTCRWLAEHASEYPCQTFLDVSRAVDAGTYQARAVPPCRLNRPLRSYARKAAQVWNNLYWT